MEGETLSSRQHRGIPLPASLRAVIAYSTPDFPRLAEFSGNAALGVLLAIAVLKDSLEVARLKRTFALQIVGQIKSAGGRDAVEPMVSR